jgi:uncharacterized membrane protein
MVLFDAVYLIALTVWVGGAVFLSFVLAPTAFKVLGPAEGGRLVLALFPRYYQWGAISGAFALPAAVAVPLCFPELRGPVVGFQALVILAATLITLYAGNVLAPAISAAHNAGPAGQARVARLYRRSIRLNAVVLVLGLVLLVAFAARRAPRTTGIVEPTPVERARAQASRVERTTREARPERTDLSRPGR